MLKKSENTELRKSNLDYIYDLELRNERCIVVLLKIFPNFWYNISANKITFFAYVYAKNEIKQN